MLNKIFLTNLPGFDMHIGGGVYCKLCFQPISCLSCVIRKPTFCKCGNKGTDQLRGNHAAYPVLCNRYIDSTIPLLSIYLYIQNFKHLAMYCDCTTRFVLDLVGN